ncbi:MAG: hypothetical protein II658_04130, partial [Prevotella sp.]|nr:hypothetical protein [Prevotella sp.]
EKRYQENNNQENNDKKDDYQEEIALLSRLFPCFANFCKLTSQLRIIANQVSCLVCNNFLSLQYESNV